MKYKVAIRFLQIGALVSLGSLSWCGYRACTSTDSTVATPQATQPTQVQAPNPVVPQQVAPVPQPAVTLTAAEVRRKVDAWLQANGDRHGQTQLRNILPSEPFNATAIRFKDADASKWSDDSRQWSQIRIDLNRDGVDDEKWLLKNGRTYKREVLDSTGRAVGSPEYFK